MDPKHKKYILENINKRSIKEIAGVLGIREREVKTFLDKKELLAGNRKGTQAQKTGIALPGIFKILALSLPALILLIATFCCYSDLITSDGAGNFTHMIKWDIFDFTYPILIFNSDCIRSLIFPFWNPYVFGGIPHASNPLVYLFHPIFLAVILLKGYSLQMLQVQVFLTFFIAGINMYICLKNFSLSTIASLIGAVIFLGCGFFVGNTEHFQHINVMAFFPLALMLVNRLINRPGLFNMSLGALAISLLAFGGYPSMLTNSLYVLFMFGMLKIFFIDKNLQREVILRKTAFLVSFFALGICASSILLIPAFQNALLSVRAQGAPLESIKTNSLPFAYLTDMWFPFLAHKSLPGTSLDITLRNCVIGLTGLFFCLHYLIFNRSRLKWSLLICLSVTLILALGTNTPLYPPIIKFIPFMKHIRHPALDHRAFFLFFSCLLAGLGANDILGSGKAAFKRSLISLLILVLTALSAAVYLKEKYGTDVAGLMIKEYPFTLLILLFLPAIALLTRAPYKKFTGAALLVFCIIDMSCWVRTNFFTVASPASNSSWEYIKNLESGRNRRVDNNNEFKRRSAARYPISIEDNFAQVLKYFTDGGNIPIMLKYYDEVIKSPNRKIITEDFRALPIYEVRLLPDEKEVLSGMNNSGTDLKKTALVNEKDINNAALSDKLKNLYLKEPGDFSSKITHYDPNRVEYEIKASSPALVFFNEVYYPGWRLYSKGKRLDLFRINHAFRGAYLDPGEYNLRMVFSPGSFKLGLLLSLISFLFIFFVSARGFNVIIKSHRSQER